VTRPALRFAEAAALSDDERHLAGLDGEYGRHLATLEASWVGLPCKPEAG